MNQPSHQQHSDKSNRPPRQSLEPDLTFKLPSRTAIDLDRHFRYEGQYYCSRSEAACAALMARYLGFKPRDGISIQVPLAPNRYGDMRYADFLVRGVILEYHPVQMPTDPTYWRMLKATPIGKRDDFRKAWNHAETERYREKRQKALNESLLFQNSELLVVTSPEEFFHKVLCRFMRADHPDQSWRIPSRERVISEFRHIQRQVEDLSDVRTARSRRRRAA